MSSLTKRILAFKKILWIFSIIWPKARFKRCKKVTFSHNSLRLIFKKMIFRACRAYKSDRRLTIDLVKRRAILLTTNLKRRRGRVLERETINRRVKFPMPYQMIYFNELILNLK